MSNSTHSWMNFPIRTSHIHLMKRPTERLRPARALFDCRSWSPHTVYMAAARKHAWDAKGVWLDQRIAKTIKKCVYILDTIK